jgi:hypothetical protein
MLSEEACQALAIYGGAGNPQWEIAFVDSVLSKEQIAQTKELIAKLLNQRGLRLAMYDTNDEAGHRAPSNYSTWQNKSSRQPPVSGWPECCSIGGLVMMNKPIGRVNE